jgi:hypothetical protein
MTRHPERRGLKPIQLVRYGLPGGILLAGVIVAIVASNTISRALGIVLIGVALLVFVVNVMARLTISSQDDRDREQREREQYPRQRPRDR